MSGAAAQQRQAAALQRLATHGKTFNWARRLLGRDTGLLAAELYAFCRHVDDIADGDAPGGAALLARIAAALDGQVPPPDAETRQFLELAAQTGINLQAAKSLLTGLLFDQGEVALPDEEALLLYAYRVAGTVGLMMAPILGSRSAAADRHAVDLGIAMQLTNIARDIAEDAGMGRRYVPAAWCGGATAQDIAASLADDNAARPALQQAAAKLLDLADDYYRSGYAGLAYLPLRAHLSIGVAGYCYQAIGRKLRRNGLAYWRGRTVVGVGGKLLASFASLATLRHRRRGKRGHNQALHRALRGELREHGST